MAANYNNDNVRVFGSKNDRIVIAPLGTTLPTTGLADLVAPWVDLGWLDESGIPLGVSTDVEKFKGHQGAATIRTKITNTEKTLGINALEDSPVVARLFWGGAATATETSLGSGVYRYDMPEGIDTVAVAACVYVEDIGANGEVVWKMFCYERIEIGEREEIPHSATELSAFRMSAEIVGDSYFLTNSAAYATA